MAEKVEGPRQLTLRATRSYDYGILRFTVNGARAGQDFDGYAPRPEIGAPIELGVFPPQEGRLVLRVEVVGTNPASRGPRHYFGLDAVQVLPP